MSHWAFTLTSATRQVAVQKYTCANELSRSQAESVLFPTDPKRWQVEIFCIAFGCPSWRQTCWGTMLDLILSSSTNWLRAYQVKRFKMALQRQYRHANTIDADFTWCIIPTLVQYADKRKLYSAVNSGEKATNSYTLIMLLSLRCAATLPNMVWKSEECALLVHKVV